MDKYKWLVPILAAITFLLDGGHLAHLIGPEWLVLVAAFVTTVVAFVQARAGGTDAAKAGKGQASQSQTPKGA